MCVRFEAREALLQSAGAKLSGGGLVVFGADASWGERLVVRRDACHWVAD